MPPARGSQWRIPPIRVHRPGRSGWVEWVSLLINFRNASQLGTQKKRAVRLPGSSRRRYSPPIWQGALIKRPLGVSPPCLQHFRRAAAVKARPVRRLVGSVGDCVKQSPSLDGRCSAEYPPRRGVTPSYPFPLSISPVSGHFSLCYLVERYILARPLFCGSIFLLIEPPILLLIS